MKTITAEYKGISNVFDTLTAEAIKALHYVKSTLAALSRGCFAKAANSRTDKDLSEALLFMAETLASVLDDNGAAD